MSSKTEIANLAISHLGVGKSIANIETEKSEEAVACRLFFDTSVEATLADLDWSFATAFSVLNLIEENPREEWNYSYRYPTDCISLRRIISGTRNDTSETRVPFKISKDTAGLIIYTDQQEAEVEYTQNVGDPKFFSPEFSLALSFRLASYIAPRLTGGDPFKLKAEMLAQYDLEIGRAKKRNMNEETPEKQPDSELIRVRT